MRHLNIFRRCSCLSFGGLPTLLAIAQSPITLFAHPYFTLLETVLESLAVTSDTSGVTLLFVYLLFLDPFPPLRLFSSRSSFSC